MNAHDRARKLAAIALDFELIPSERDELDSHLAGCDSCRSFVGGMTADGLAMASLPRIDAPEQVRRAVLEGRRPASGRSARPLFAVLVLALVTLVPLGAGTVFFGGLGGESAGGTAAPAYSVGPPPAGTTAPTVPQTPAPTPSMVPSASPSQSPATTSGPN